MIKVIVWARVELFLTRIISYLSGYVAYECWWSFWWEPEHVMTRCQLFFWLQLWNHFQRLFKDFFQAANGQVPLPSFMRCTWLLGSGLSRSAFVPCCCASCWPTWVERLLTILGILGVTAISWMFGSGPMLRLTLPACTSAVIACDWALDICMWECFRRTSDVMVTPGSLSSLSSVIYIYI